jgi:hypothetical protein
VDRLQDLCIKQQRRLSRLGVPDLEYIRSLEPQLADFKALIETEMYAAIEKCCSRSPSSYKFCHIPICPCCSVVQRTKITEAACKLQYEERLRGVFLTFAPPYLTAPLGSLAQHRITNIVREINRTLSDVSARTNSTVAAVGAFDVSLNERQENSDLQLTAAERKERHELNPHLHITILAENPEHIAASVKERILAGRTPIRGEFKVLPVYCLGRTIMYCTKCRPVRRAAGRDNRGNYRPQTRPMAKAPMSEALRWLASGTEDERIFTFFKPGRSTP